MVSQHLRSFCTFDLSKAAWDRCVAVGVHAYG